MKGRIIVGIAVATYLAVVGCVVWPGGGAAGVNAAADAPIAIAPRVKLDGLPLRGVAVQVQDIRNIDLYKSAIDEIAGVGADTVEFVVSARMEHGSSARVFIDLRNCPTPAQLADLISRAKEKKLRVMLMPIVLLEAPRGSEWRGTIHPESQGRSAWDEWFDSYREMLGHFAKVAQDNKVDLLVVGSELVSTEVHSAEWTKTIQMARGVFKGMLTYSSNWDHYIDIPFWDQLDIIGMNSYWKLGDDPTDPDVKLRGYRPPTVESIQARWRDIQKDLTAFSSRKGKPILLVEVGWCSIRNAPYEPWDYTKAEEPLDLDLQRRLYEGFFRSWYGNPNMAGFMVWEWEPFSGGGPGNRSYTPKGKPAEKVLRDWLAKGPWEVK